MPSWSTGPVLYREMYILPIAFCPPLNSPFFLNCPFLGFGPLLNNILHSVIMKLRIILKDIVSHFLFLHKDHRRNSLRISPSGVFLLEHWFVPVLHCDSRIDSSYLAVLAAKLFAGIFVFHSQKMYQLL